MTLSGVITILMYALAPFAWLIVLGLAVLLGVQLVAHLKGYRLFAYRCLGANLVALMIGLSTLWWLPLATHSRLAYVATVTDWVALIGAAIGVGMLAWLVLTPLSYLVRGRRS
ncbi:hypothetical protein [Halomonas sp. 328]|uniref:hypothetical protein n=1 Tax=Halomonas sp. 328 TaxID=2776704 RepID=UPI0018A6DC74|nr:hypothetical protein [Halomonas sp. 328]MBF8223151.1 hypothetical protein [Halomonas sp. 328]